MTHLFVVVLIKKDMLENVEDNVSKLLASYNEELEVSEYDEECSCVGFAARGNAFEAAKRKFGTTTSRDALEFAKEIFEADSGRLIPEVSCTLCGGKGKYRTTLNPEGKWDWWAFGGRFDGAVENDFSKVNPDMRSHTHRLEGNVSTPQFLIDHDIIPYALVTPDGCWHEEEYWKRWQWEETAKSILAENLETLAVGLDIHA